MNSKYICLIGFFLIFVVNENQYSSVEAVPFFECKQHNLRLLQIISFVCNNSQPAVQLRDACYGCFLRATSLPAGPPQLIGLSQCSTLYLLNSTYNICANDLALAVVGLKPINPILTLTCSTGYCDFVRCLRQINSVNLINSCFTANLVDRNFNLVPDRIRFFTNTTACILARARCSDVNPITADFQRQRGSVYPIGITNAVGTAGFFYYNALQIARNGDIKIIGLPSAWVLGNTFCSRNISLDQSPYDQETCPNS